jgi:hypothetical protein
LRAIPGDLAIRFFNTAGPVNLVLHYCLPPLERFDLQDVRRGASEGHLAVFDCTPGKSWDDKLFIRQQMIKGRMITVWGM